MIAAALLALVVILYRVVLGVVGVNEGDWLHNFSPLAAVALCGAIYFPRRVALLAAPFALFISDLILNAHYQIALLSWAMLPQYVALALVCALGWFLRGQARPSRTLLASLFGSTLFFFLTNTAAWMVDPFYPKSVAGWAQALTVGHPEYTPTLAFFRNSLLSDLTFTALFLLCLGRQGRTQPASAALNRAELAPW